MTDEKYTKKVTVREIVNFFHFRQISGDDASLDRWVVVPDVNRPGFELAGYFKPTEPRRIVILGNKEMEYISHLGEQDQRDRFAFIMDGFTPMIIITHDNPCPPILKDIADSRDFPIFSYDGNTYQLMVDLINYLDEKLAPEDTLSGDLMVVYGKGVLITGESGMGKSEVALELIRDGQVLVSDDRVDVLKMHNALYGQTPALLKGMLEIRGIGIIDVERVFGTNYLQKMAKIDLVINLVPFNSSEEYERIGGNNTSVRNILGIKVPAMVLPVSPGRSTATLVETAVSNLILQEEGYNSTKEFKERLYKILEDRSKGKNQE